jgi:hypothetical protein
MALSVAVRPGPAVTYVNGTVVARPARTTWYTLSRWLQPWLQGEACRR